MVYWFDLYTRDVIVLLYNIYRPVVYCAIPLIIITTLTIILVIKLRTKNNRLTNRPDVRRHKNNATRVLIIVNIVFVVCSLPWSVHILLIYAGKMGVEYRILRGSIYFFHIVNSSINVLIYIMFSKSYREVAIQNIRCICSRTRSEVAQVAANYG